MSMSLCANTIAVVPYVSLHETKFTSFIPCSWNHGSLGGQGLWLLFRII